MNYCAAFSNDSSFCQYFKEPKGSLTTAHKGKVITDFFMLRKCSE
jgi:hypothetical protein